MNDENAQGILKIDEHYRLRFCLRVMAVFIFLASLMLVGAERSYFDRTGLAEVDPYLNIITALEPHAHLFPLDEPVDINHVREYLLEDVMIELSEIDQLRFLKVPEVERLGLLVAPYNDNEVQGIFGERVKIIARIEQAHRPETFSTPTQVSPALEPHLPLHDMPIRALHLHLYGADGEISERDDLNVSFVDFFSERPIYIAPYQAAIRMEKLYYRLPILILIILISLLLFYHFLFPGKIFAHQQATVKEAALDRLWMTAGYTSFVYMWLFLYFRSLLKDDLWLQNSMRYTFFFSAIFTAFYMITQAFSVASMALYAKAYRDQQTKLGYRRCPKCKYELSGLEGDRVICPECGYELNM